MRLSSLAMIAAAPRRARAAPAWSPSSSPKRPPSISSSSRAEAGSSRWTWARGRARRWTPRSRRLARPASPRSSSTTTGPELEPAPFQYQSARLAADNTYYSTAPHAMSIVLNIRPIAGACRVVPPDLAAVAWNDPVMTTRFGYLLTWIHGYLPGLNVKVMSVGTEVDTHLAPADYPAYKTFFEAARQNAKSLWGASLPVGVTVARDSLAVPGPEQAAILDLNERADHVLYTYYPLNADFTVKDPYSGPIADTYAAIAAVEGNPKTAGRPIDLIEVGYPTSSALGSSLGKQQSFVAAMFGIWDAYYPRIPTMVFNWEADLSEQSAELRGDRRLGRRLVPGTRRGAAPDPRGDHRDAAGTVREPDVAILRGRGERERQLVTGPHRPDGDRRGDPLERELQPAPLGAGRGGRAVQGDAARRGRRPGDDRPHRDDDGDDVRRQGRRVLDLRVPGVHPHARVPDALDTDDRQAGAHAARHRGARARAGERAPPTLPARRIRARQIRRRDAGAAAQANGSTSEPPVPAARLDRARPNAPMAPPSTTSASARPTQLSASPKPTRINLRRLRVVSCRHGRLDHAGDEPERADEHRQHLHPDDEQHPAPLRLQRELRRRPHEQTTDDQRGVHAPTTMMKRFTHFAIAPCLGIQTARPANGFIG